MNVGNGTEAAQSISGKHKFAFRYSAFWIPNAELKDYLSVPSCHLAYKTGWSPNVYPLLNVEKV
jgi:hypothetical protein